METKFFKRLHIGFEMKVKFYTENQLEIQKELKDTELAESALKLNVRTLITPRFRTILENLLWVSIATVNSRGEPDVSIKAISDETFKIVNDNEILLVLESGNGMNITLGNLHNSNQDAIDRKLPVSIVGVSIKTGQKIRIKGHAKIIKINKENNNTNVLITINNIWENCPRFKRQILEHETLKRQNTAGYFPVWKRIDLLYDTLTSEHKKFAKSKGLITTEEWSVMIQNGLGDGEYDIQK
jgi:hypothetical protein